jgi:tellurite resistance protein TerC
LVRRALAISYRQARRIAVAVIGTSVLLAGVALLVLPGPAFLVIPLGLGILSVEFAFARRWLHEVERRSRAALGMQPRPRPAELDEPARPDRGQ